MTFFVKETKRMSDGKLEIDTQINTDGVEKGLKKLKSNLTAIKGLGMSAVIGAEVKALKSLVKGINDTAQAYNVQAKAEKQLEVASKNNPYLDSQSVKQLKEYASYLQSISTVGDEQLIPMMSQLASTGRTQAEIQTIMKTALDVSASGMMSLDSAVTQLNATFSGNVGQLGRQISELKDLTKEELESGKAVEILSQKFKGMAEDVSSATGSYEKMKNAQGDFNEALGKITKPSVDLWNNFWQKWYEAGIEKIEKLNAQLETVDLRNSLEKMTGFKGTTEDDVFDYYEAKIRELSDAQVSALSIVYSAMNPEKMTANQQAILGIVKAEMYDRELTAEKIRQQNEELEKQRQIEEQNAKAQKDRKQLAEDSYKNFQKTIKNAQKEIALRKQLGEVITEEEELQEMVNVKTQAYIQLLEDADGTITGTSERELNFIAELNAEYEKLYAMKGQDNPDADLWKDLQDAIESINASASKGVIEGLKAQRDELDKLAEGLDKASDLYQQYADAREKVDKQISQAQKEALAQQLSNINAYFDQFADITMGITSLIRQANEQETDQAMTEVSKQYTDGLISYEEYCDKKDEIQRDALRKEYKLKMWEYTSSLLTATSNIAEGITKALAGVPPMSFINAGLVATSGALQIATLVANKPKPPAFANGGIVGATMGADNTLATVRTGEMVLNAVQQRQLWNMANGQGGGGSVVQMSVNIENNASNEVSASAQMTKEGLRVVIDKMVNSSMQQGRYNQSMQIADGKRQGVSVL